MNPKHLFFVNVNGDITQVYPLNFSKCKIQDQQNLDQGQIFYRKKFTGKLTFVRKTEAGTNDYEFFRLLETNGNRCTEIELTIFKRCVNNEGEYKLMWTGIFSTGIGSFDIDLCEFEVTPEVKDKYTCVLDNDEQEVNILENENLITTNTVILPDYEYYVCRNPIGSFCAGCMGSIPAPPSSWKLMYSAEDCYNYVCIYVRERAVTSCQAGVPTPPSGSGWVLLLDDCANSNSATYVRQPLEVFTPLSNYDVSPGACTGTSGTVPQLPPKPFCDSVALASQGSRTGHVPYGTGEWSQDLLVPTQFKLQVFGSENSTYVWDIPVDGTILTIAAGQGTQLVTIEAAAGNPVFLGFTANIRCRETTVCGDVITYTKLVEFSPFTRHSFPDFYVVGPNIVCPDQSSVTFTVIEPFKLGPGVNWNMQPQFGTITSGQNTWEITVDFDYNGTLTFPLNVLGPVGNTDAGFGQVSLIYTHQVSFRRIPYTNKVENCYQLAICPGAIQRYEVWNRPGSTFEWIVTNGTVLTGQGTSVVTIEWDSSPGTGNIYLKETADQCGCTYIQLAECGPGGEPPYYWCYNGSYLEYDRNRSLMGSIEFILGQMGCEIVQVASDLFEWNPPADTPGYSAGINYVTGGTNVYNLLTIAQKSDIIDPMASNPATIGKTTLKDMLDFLRKTFQVYWIIENGKLRLEHISWFKYSMGLDVTQPQFALSMKGTNKFTHLKDEIPKYERFKWMEAKNQDFIGVDIIYLGRCVPTESNKKVQEYNNDRITTDLEYIKTSPSDISKEGFVVLANYDNGGTIFVIDDVGALSLNVFANAPMSWANLHETFFKHDRYLPFGKLNNVEITFASFKNTVKQDPFTITLCCEYLSYDPQLLVKTPLGANSLGDILGNITQSEYDPVLNTLKLTIGYSY